MLPLFQLHISFDHHGATGPTERGETFPLRASPVAMTRESLAEPNAIQGASRLFKLIQGNSSHFLKPVGGASAAIVLKNRSLISVRCRSSASCPVGCGTEPRLGTSPQPSPTPAGERLYVPELSQEGASLHDALYDRLFKVTAPTNYLN